MNFPKVLKLSQGKNLFFPEYHYWGPDFSDFSLPRGKDGGPYTDPEDFEAYLNWLDVHLENTDLPLNLHTGISEDGSELIPGMIKLQTFLIFDFMCRQAEKEYRIKKAYLPDDATIFNDIGWRSLLKVIISRTNNWWEKRKALKRFHINLWIDIPYFLTNLWICPILWP